MVDYTGVDGPTKPIGFYLRPHTDPEFVRRKANPLPKILEGAEIYEIERIIDHDFKFGTQWYKIAWKGFSEIYESTWEPRHELMKMPRRQSSNMKGRRTSS